MIKGGLNLVRLICEKCGETWYTANTRPNQKCSECNGNLIQCDSIFPENVDTKKTATKKNNYEKDSLCFTLA